MSKKANKLGTRATKAERAEAHRIKMEMKQMLRGYYSEEVARENDYVLANISRNHEHYGDTPTEHERRKNSEKSS